MAFNGISFGLPFAMNSVEGSEASMFVAAGATRAGWRRAMIALGAALVTLVPFAVVLWAAFHFVGAEYLDYAIAFLVFALGLRELREGLGERPKGGPTAADLGQVERIGLSVVNRASIAAFQRRHDLPVTGDVDDRTRPALLALRREAGYREVDPLVFGVDAGDTTAVRAFQRRHGLEVTGDVEGPTRGALRVAQQQGLVDVLDEDAVRRFQAAHALPATGQVDHDTAIAIATVRAEGATSVGDDDHRRRVDPVGAWRRLDAADADTVRRFQRSLGLAADGAVGPETRGALRAMHARLVVDPADHAQTVRFQKQAGLPASGVIDDATRETLAEATAKALSSPPARGSEPDPADEESVRYFQRRYGLGTDGVVGPDTQAAIHYERDWFVGVDPSDMASIRCFQRSHGLSDDGVIGPETQSAIRSLRAERRPTGKRARSRRYRSVEDSEGTGPRLNVDFADADAVSDFQGRHGLERNGCVDQATQEAFALARRTRINGEELVGAHAVPTGKPRGPQRLRSAMGQAWPAYVGVILETSEALLYSFAVTSSSASFVPAVVGAGIGFSWPWTVLPLLRRLTQHVAEWKQEAVIGVILVSVAAAFGLLHMVGVFR